MLEYQNEKSISGYGGIGSIVAEALAVRDEARQGWRRGQNLSALQAETNFGNRKSLADFKVNKHLWWNWQTR